MARFPALKEVGPARAEGSGPKTSPIYRAAYNPKPLEFPDGVETLADSWNRSVRLFPNEPALGRRTDEGYSWLTFREADKKVAQLAAALAARGFERGAPLGVYGPNSVEWMLTMQVANRRTYRVVPLYDTLGDDAVRYVIDHADATAVFALGDKLPELAKALAKTRGSVRTVVWWGEAPEGAVEAIIASSGLDAGSVLTFEQLLVEGAAAPEPEPALPGPLELCTIMYTSGTTGDPKGVELSHRAVLASVLGLQSLVNDGLKFRFGVGDTYFSFLPLAHIFDRVAEEFLLFQGGAVGYWRGDPRRMVEDVAALRPTLFCGVPRVFERIRSAVLDKVQHGGALKRTLFNHAYKRKIASIRGGAAFDRAAPFWDRLVFKKVAAALGGRVRVIVSGGAPLPLRVEEFLRVAFCCRIVQGYGLTETSAATVLSLSGDPKQIGATGLPTPAFEFRLEEVAEMGADPTRHPPRGELCVRGPALFDHYHKNDELRAEVVDADGFFHTGDVAELDDNGAIHVVDRKKNIFKLAQGEYIAVEKIEAAYLHSPAVEQIWVYGNSFESQLVAVVVPKETWAKKKYGGSGSSAPLEQLAKDPAFAKAIQATLDAAAKEAGLKGFEKVKAIHVEPELFSIENDLLTPTFKYKRPQLLKHYKTKIDELYAKLNGA